MSSDKPKLIAAYIREWLERQRQEAELASDIQHARSAAEWQEAAYADIYPYLPESDRKVLDSRFDLAYHHLKSELPMPPSYGPGAVTGISSAVATGTMGTYGFAIGLRDLGPLAFAKAQPHIASFQRLQASQNRVTEVRGLLFKISAKLADQFERANDEQVVVSTHPDRVATAALEIRTVVDNLKGELFERARNTPRENMTWEIMADRLAKRASHETSVALLLEQRSERGSLIDKLSALAKSRSEANEGELSNLWSLVLGHSPSPTLSTAWPGRSADLRTPCASDSRFARRSRPFGTRWPPSAPWPTRPRPPAAW